LHFIFDKFNSLIFNDFGTKKYSFKYIFHITVILKNKFILYYTILKGGEIMVITTIKLDKKTKEKLDKLKIHPRETYEQVILRLIEREVKK